MAASKSSFPSESGCTAALGAELEQLRTDLVDRAYELDCRGQHGAAELAAEVAARLAQLIAQNSDSA